MQRFVMEFQIEQETNSVYICLNQSKTIVMWCLFHTLNLVYLPYTPYFIIDKEVNCFNVDYEVIIFYTYTLVS